MEIPAHFLCKKKIFIDLFLSHKLNLYWRSSDEAASIGKDEDVQIKSLRKYQLKLHLKCILIFKSNGF